MKATIRVKSPAGFMVEFTTPEIEDRHLLLQTLPLFEDELLEAGYTPATGPAVAVASMPGAASAPAQPAAPTVLSVPVAEITATVADGKAYWRVKGGEFQKWGVIVYPEVLEAAGLTDLNPLKPFNEPGWVAHYVTKEDGKPKKVVALLRA
jgi:hypothetical protein